MAVPQVPCVAVGAAIEQVGQLGAASSLDIGKEGLVNEVRMIPIHAIFDLKLPVGLVAILMDSCRHIQFSFWREVHNEIKLLFDWLAQVLVERNPYRTQAAKDESAVHAHAWRLAQPKIFFAEPFAIAVLVSNS